MEEKGRTCVADDVLVREGVEGVSGAAKTGIPIALIAVVDTLNARA